jgi:hypothetical protein
MANGRYDDLRTELKVDITALQERAAAQSQAVNLQLAQAMEVMRRVETKVEAIPGLVKQHKQECYTERQEAYKQRRETETQIREAAAKECLEAREEIQTVLEANSAERLAIRQSLEAAKDMCLGAVATASGRIALAENKMAHWKLVAAMAGMFLAGAGVTHYDKVLALLRAIPIP